MADCHTNSARPDSEGLSRRKILVTAPMAAIGLALATNSACAAGMSDTAESPVLKAFNHWHALTLAWGQELKRPDYVDEESVEWCARIDAAASAVVDQESTSPMDFLYKLFAQTHGGEFDIYDCQRGEDVVAELHSFVDRKV